MTARRQGWALLAVEVCETFHRLIPRQPACGNAGFPKSGATPARVPGESPAPREHRAAFPLWVLLLTRLGGSARSQPRLAIVDEPVVGGGVERQVSPLLTASRRVWSRSSQPASPIVDEPVVGGGGGRGVSPLLTASAVCSFSAPASPVIVDESFVGEWLLLTAFSGSAHAARLATIVDIVRRWLGATRHGPGARHNGRVGFSSSGPAPARHAW